MQYSDDGLFLEKSDGMFSGFRFLCVFDDSWGRVRGWTDEMTVYAHIMSPPEQYARPSPREHIIPTTSESCHAWESVGRSSESVRDWFIYLNFRLYEV